MKVLFFAYAPKTNASSRYRVYKYIPYFDRDGIYVKVCPPVNEQIYNLFYKFLMQKNGIFIKLFYYFFLVLPNRIFQLFQVRKFDVIVIQRELFPYGNAWLERIIALFNKKIIYDFDDAIFTKPTHYQTNKSIKDKIKNFLNGEDPVKTRILLSKLVIVGNEYLYNYAKNYHQNVVIIPTSIDLNEYKVEYKETEKQEIIIGWIGNPGNLYYLNLVDRVLAELRKKYNFKFKVVSSQEFNSRHIKVENKKWREVDEVADISSFDIGIMPLEDNEYTRGKGGFKLIQYMGLGIPSIASPVGINSEIIQDGVNGFLAKDETEWYVKLEKLIINPELRKCIGLKGRRSIEDRFSISNNYVVLRNNIKKVMDSEV